MAHCATHALAPPCHLLMLRQPPLPSARQPAHPCRYRCQPIFQRRHAAQRGREAAGRASRCGGGERRRRERAQGGADWRRRRRRRRRRWRSAPWRGARPRTGAGACVGGSAGGATPAPGAARAPGRSAARRRPTPARPCRAAAGSGSGANPSRAARARGRRAAAAAATSRPRGTVPRRGPRRMVTVPRRGPRRMVPPTVGSPPRHPRQRSSFLPPAASGPRRSLRSSINWPSRPGGRKGARPRTWKPGSSRPAETPRVRQVRPPPSASPPASPPLRLPPPPAPHPRRGPSSRSSPCRGQTRGHAISSTAGGATARG